MTKRAAISTAIIIQSALWWAATAFAAPPHLAHVVNRRGDSVSVVDPSTMTIVDTIPVGDKPTEIALTQNKRHLYVTLTGDDGIAVVSVADRVVEETIPGGGSPWGIVFGRGGRHVYVSNGQHHSVDVFRVSDGTLVETISHPDLDTPHGMALSPGGQFLYVANVAFLAGGNAPENVTVIRTSDNTVVDTVDVSALVNVFGPWDVTVLPNGQKAYTNDGDDGEHVLAIDVNRGSPTLNEVVATISIGSSDNGPRGMESGWTPEGLRVFAALAESDEVVAIDPGTDEVVARIATTGRYPWRLRLSPTGKQLWVSLRDSGQVEVYDTKTHELLDVVSGFDQPADIVFAPN